MESKYNSSKEKDQEQSKLTNSKNMLENLKSDYFIKTFFFDFILERKSLKIIRLNKSIQKRVDVNITNYKACSEKYSSIEIEIKPRQFIQGQFINIEKEEDKKYYHIYFNGNKKKEVKSTSLEKNHKVSKINIIIDYQITSFKNLFILCRCIESINFKKFYRNNITNMNSMFAECTSLKEINLDNLKTDNVIDMNCMFLGCSSLKKLNLNNINTKNVTKMEGMFGGCESLKELDLSSFNTSKVTNMNCMFQGCKLLKELNIKNFKMNNATEMIAMFYGCPDELKFKIKRKFKNIKEEAFKGF